VAAIDRGHHHPAAPPMIPITEPRSTGSPRTLTHSIRIIAIMSRRFGSTSSA
jgi:hypothetical protein